MTISDDISLADLLDQGALPEAVETAVARVKSAPQNPGIRVMLSQLLALTGDLERAETHARMAQTLDADRATALSEYRQYLRALHARAAWWAEGAAPDFPGEPTALDALALALHVALRAGDVDKAAAQAAALEEARRACPARWDDVAVPDLRDVDDRLPHALEALAPGGHYLWIDLARVSQIALSAVSAPFDLLARPARLTLRDGSVADLRLVAIYDAPRDASEQLARVTEFSQIAPGLTRAHGQRAYLLNDEMGGLLEPAMVVFDG